VRRSAPNVAQLPRVGHTPSILWTVSGGDGNVSRLALSVLMPRQTSVGQSAGQLQRAVSVPKQTGCTGMPRRPPRQCVSTGSLYENVVAMR
jgi:hypothetical protein